MGNRKTLPCMNILALETSQSHASLCLSKGEKLCFETAWTADRNHDSWLFPALEQALACLSEGESLDYILVGAGPGSYGGVRVALAAAVGVATVTGARTVALCSWGALADSRTGIVSDAKRGGWTLRRPNGEIIVLSPDELKQEARHGLKLATIEQIQTVAPLELEWEATGLTPTAPLLLHSWNQLSEQEQQTLAARPPEPIYVRPPHITQALHKPWEIRK